MLKSILWGLNIKIKILQNLSILLTFKDSY
jgi:hypothetical protein